MVNIQPFKATRYNSNKIPDLAAVITPPYDVINSQQQTKFYERSPYSFIRVDYTQSNSYGDPYQVSAEHLDEWLREGILKQDEQPSIYFYQQDFTYRQRSYSRTSIFALCELAPYKEQLILPHERTMDAPKEDRLQLMRATEANLSPIWTLYSDPHHQLLAKYRSFLEQESPLIQFTDDINLEHKLWVYTDPDGLRDFHRWFAGQQLFIADGHHRYETALAYQEESVLPASRFILVCLTNAQDPNHLVLSTHRLLTSAFKRMNNNVFLEKASQYFDIEAIAPNSIEETLAQASTNQCCIAVQLGKQAYAFTREKQLPQGIKESHSSAYRLLDVAIFQELILTEILKFPDQWIRDRHYIRYSPLIGEIQQWIKDEVGDAAFFLNPTTIQELCDVSLADDIMPPKSTYFYPKLPSGLVVHRFNETIS